MSYIDLLVQVFPSEELVEIPQRPYHPVHIEPLAWLLDLADIHSLPDTLRKQATDSVAKISAELHFKHQGAP